MLTGLLLVIGGASDADEPRADRTLKITVLGADKKPLPKAKIHAAIWAKVPAKTNRDYVCDELGQTIVELPPEVGILRLWVRSDGYVSMFAHWSPQFVEQKLIPEEDPIPEKFTFELEKGATIGGTVVDGDGQPIPGVRVQAVLDMASARLEHRVEQANQLAGESDGPMTDALGRWSLNNVPDEATGIRFMLSHPDYLSDYEWRRLPGNQATVIDMLRAREAKLVMARGTTVTGTVTDADGKGVAEALVIWGEDPYHQNGSQEVRTDAQGKYKLPPLANGKQRVTVVAPGWAPDQQKIDLSDTLPPVDFRLVRGKTIRIRFIEPGGRPIPDVQVMIDSWRDGKALYNHKHPSVLDTTIPTAADMKGVYEWTWAPDDDVIYDAGKPGYQPPETFFVSPEDKEFVITLRKLKGNKSR